MICEICNDEHWVLNYVVPVFIWELIYDRRFPTENDYSYAFYGCRNCCIMYDFRGIVEKDYKHNFYLKMSEKKRL
jgi:hypothetical protein